MVVPQNLKRLRPFNATGYKKKSHYGQVLKPLKRRRAEELDEGVDDKERKTSRQQRLGSSHDFASNMLPAISRTVCSAHTTYDTVVMEEGRYDPGVHLNKSAKKLLPIITKQNRDDGEVLVKELSQAQLIPWKNLNEIKVFLTVTQ